LTIRSGNDNHSSIHIGSTCNHILDVIGVTGTIDMRVMTAFSLVLNVRRCNCNTTLPFFRGFVDCSILEKVGKPLFRLAFGDGCCQGCLYDLLDKASENKTANAYLSMIDVANRAYLSVSKARGSHLLIRL
jgi:hypothetical protein